MLKLKSKGATWGYMPDDFHPTPTRARHVCQNGQQIKDPKEIEINQPNPQDW